MSPLPVGRFKRRERAKNSAILKMALRFDQWQAAARFSTNPGRHQHHVQNIPKYSANQIYNRTLPDLDADDAKGSGWKSSSLPVKNNLDAEREEDAAMATPAKIEGAVPKKVYMHYEEAEEVLQLTLKMTLPSKWAGHSVDYLKEVR